MQIPTKKALLEFQQNFPRAKSWSFASGVHPNPKLFKYYWWVFHEDSIDEGSAFLNNDANRLCTYYAMELIRQIKQTNKPCFIYNQKLPRNDINSPFNFSSDRWKDVEKAPAFDEDTDPVYKGFK